MRTVVELPETLEIARNDLDDERLERFLKGEIEGYYSQLADLHHGWETFIRQYRGIPMHQFSRDPIPIRNIEVTVGATACDAIFSQSYDAIMNTTPLVMVRPSPDAETKAEAFQILLNHMANDTFTNFKEASKDFMCDTIWLGTGFFYTGWEEDHKITGTDDVIDWGPRVSAIDPVDIIVPGNAGPDLQTIRVMGYRMELTEGELQLRAQQCGWDADWAAPASNLSNVRRERADAAHIRAEDKTKFDKYDIYELYVYFPYHGQNDQDLYVVWDRVSAKILYLAYNPFDSRPFTMARYQFQPHVFFGLGVMEMASPLQFEISDWHNFRMANARLCNSRAWGVKNGSSLAGMKLRIVPNKPLFFDDPKDLQPYQMADVYPSALQYEQADMQLLERRVGTMNDFQSKPMPGHRTPGVTMQAMLAQINRRFITSFDEMKGGMSDAMVQCVLRLQEQFKKGGENQKRIIDFVTTVCGNDKADDVLEVLRGPSRDIRNNLIIEMNASSQAINRQIQQQSSMQAMQVLAGYYDKVISLAAMVGNPQMAPGVKKIAGDIAKRMSESVGRFLNTFEDIRDPKSFILEEDDFDQLVQQSTGQGNPPNVSGGTGADAQGGAGQDGNGGGLQGGAPMSGGTPNADEYGLPPLQ